MRFINKYIVDAIAVIVLCVITFFGPFVLLGFVNYDFAYPVLYGGGSDFIGVLSGAKMLAETGWVWQNDLLAAPFGTTNLGSITVTLANFEHIVTLIIIQFTQNPFAAITIQYLLFFPFTAFTSYIVMRSLDMRKSLSFLGAWVFSWLPFVFLRIAHFELAACYFVPLSVLLCIWAYRDEDFLAIHRGFLKNKRNIAAILCALLIANNGIGYYAFFTCFFLCVVLLMKFLATKSWRAIQAPLFSILIIVLFFVLAILPSVTSEAPSVIDRNNPANAELYGLKITQLFLPVNAHGNEWLSGVIDTYNSFMPLVNENASAYLGLVGCCGFLMLIVFLFKSRKPYIYEDELILLSRLNIAAVLFATIGGFGAIFALTVTNMVRGFNRISVFIAFFSILAVCFLVERALRSEKLKNRSFVKTGFTIAIAAVFIFSAFEQIPAIDYGSSSNKDEFDSDKALVETIEENSGQNAMIWQMPYHKYPEGGIVNSMGDYQLLAGYLHSSTLRWSYGAPKGSAEDAWIERLAQMPIPEQLDTVISEGFGGIYIDSRAYQPDELKRLLDDISVHLKQTPVHSQDGKLIYFDLN